MGSDNAIEVGFKVKANDELSLVKTLLPLLKPLKFEFVEGGMGTPQKKIESENDIISYVEKYPKKSLKSAWRLHIDCSLDSMEITVTVVEPFTVEWNIYFSCYGRRWLSATKEQKKTINRIIADLKKCFRFVDEYTGSEYPEMRGRYNENGFII